MAPTRSRQVNGEASEPKPKPTTATASKNTKSAKATAAEAKTKKATASKATTTKTAVKPVTNGVKTNGLPKTKAAGRKQTPAASAKAPTAKAQAPKASSKKRKADDEELTEDEVSDARPAKRQMKVAKKPAKVPRAATPAPVAINTAPTKVLEVFVFGTGECGELGLGPEKTEAIAPKRNPFLNPADSEKLHIVQLDCGGMHTIALTKDNKIVTWGVNDKGALGRDTNWEGGLRDADASDSDSEAGDLNPKESTPTAISSDTFPPNTTFVQVAAGDSCSFAVTDTGFVYGWGTFLNSEGKECFGYGSDGKLINVQKKPALIPTIKNIVQVVCGSNHVVALEKSGKVWAWGVGEQNQLGRKVLARRRMEAFKPSPVEVCRRKAKYIASGPFHSFAVDDSGDTWVWGLNTYGQAGYPETAGTDTPLIPYPMKIEGLRGKNVTVLDGGAHHSAAVTKDGEHLVWGRMDGGQLGIKFTDEQLKDEDLIRRDENDRPRICLTPIAVPNIGKAVTVACGTDHTLFVNDEGLVFSTGFGTMAQLGLGNYDEVDVATELPKKQCGGRKFIWAGAGGQFSMIAAPPPPAS